MRFRVQLAVALGLGGLGLVGCGDDSGGSGGGGGAAATELTPDVLASRGSCAAPTGAGTDHTGTVTADETWTAAAGPHRIPTGLVVEATVTIEPCALVLLGDGATLEIGTTSAPGKVIGHGTATGTAPSLDVQPVTFDAIDPAAKWSQILVEPMGELDLAVAAIQNGGKPASGEPGALLVRGVATGTNDGALTESAKLDRVLIEGSDSYGLNLDGWGALASGSTTVWIRSSGSGANPYPIRLEAGVAHTLPPALVATGNAKDEILVRSSKAFMASDTFADHGVPYHVLGPIYVSANADGAPVTLTVEPGVTMAFEDQAGSGLIVGSSMTRQGILDAVGEEAKPIVFTSAVEPKAAGDWQALYYRASPATGNRLEHARVEYAGADNQTNSFGCGPGDNASAIVILGSGAEQKPPAEAFVKNTAFDFIAGTTVIVSGWIDDSGPDFSPTNTFGANTPDCKVSRPRRTGAGDVCDGGRDVCWP